MNKHEINAPVDGGELWAGEWREDSGGLAILAVHGITASHRAWDEVAARLPDRRFIAPDLRGRGRSNELPPPYGFAQHADDLAALLDARGIDRAFVVGHSMGAFVTMRFIDRHPDRVAGVLLVDGGLPIDTPREVAVEDRAAHLLGPALERLAMTFRTPAEYVDFWKQHPALGPYWNATIEAYAKYDLTGSEPNLRSSADGTAVLTDAQELSGGGSYEAALSGRAEHIEFLRAPRGLLDAEPLYSDDAVVRWHGNVPHLTIRTIPDVNHYTIIMSPVGAQTTADIIEARVRALENQEATANGIG